MGTLLFAVVQLVCIMLLAPFITGIIKKVKALLQNRQGPRLLQPYYDLRKYFTKDMVVSEHTSWIFHVTPYAVMMFLLSAILFIPTFGATAPIAMQGDLFVIIYFLAAARFFLVLSSLDTASAFGGMGGSREAAISALAEPVLLLSVLGLSIYAKSTMLSSIVQFGAQNGWMDVSFAHIFALLGFTVVLLAETGRIPVDNPDTHLELTMVHEGMLLEYSGKYLALLQWAASIKQLLLFSLLANVFLAGNWGIGDGLIETALAYLLKLMIICIFIAVAETSTTKMRLFRVPELMGASFVLSLLAIIAL